MGTAAVLVTVTSTVSTQVLDVAGSAVWTAPGAVGSPDGGPNGSWTTASREPSSKTASTSTSLHDVGDAGQDVVRT